MHGVRDWPGHEALCWPALAGFIGYVEAKMRGQLCSDGRGFNGRKYSKIRFGDRSGSHEMKELNTLVASGGRQ